MQLAMIQKLPVLENCRLTEQMSIKMIARANTDIITHELLSDKRQKFSVDGKASERVADLIERL